MSTADKSTLPPPVASRSTIQHILSENLPRPLVVAGEESKSSEEESTWVPELPPRPRQLVMGFSKDITEGCVPQFHEADGSCGRSSPYLNTLERSRRPVSVSQRSSPPHTFWSKNIKYLLDDVEGVNLFTRFLEDHCDKLELEKLNFCFACAGLKKKEPETSHGLVRAIYKKYFREKNLGFPSEMRERLSNQINERSSTLKRNSSLKSIFEEANAFMLDMISKTSYLAFLNSPLCLNYALSMPNHDRDNGSNSSSSSSVKDDVELGYMTNSLSTVHEGKELITKTPVKLPLTRDALLKTQSRRLETAPKMLPSPYHTKTMHPQYISCNPVSSQDSDARTESDLSITDGSMDGTSSLSRIARRANHKNLSDRKILNKDSAMHDKFVPITQKEERPVPLPTDVLLLKAIAKLNEYAEKLESEEQLKRKLEANEQPERKIEQSDGLRPDDLRAELVKVINKDALQLVEENSQDILDKHCKRVFSSDQTPVETPNPKSPPRNKSPDLPACRRSRSAFNPTPTSMSMSSSMAPPPVPAHGISSYPYTTSRSSRKKDKDGISIVSVDSGNIHDFPEGSEHYHYSSSLSSLHLPKSKSMPDYAHSLDQSKSDSAFLNTSHRSSSKWWSSKKAGDLTDSGVSVVSDTPPVPFKDKNRLRTTTTSSSGSKPLAQRSVSSEQCLSLKRFPHSVPAQPFVADSMMPPLEPPHVLTQLDEVGRRLLMESNDRCRTFRSRHSVSSKGAELPQSSYPSTLRRTMASQPSMLPSSEKATAPYPSSSNTASSEDNCTVVVYSFCNDEVPYRTKIPGNPITLKQFKDFLPKKGAFRFFFKTKCDDPDIKVIQEEIFDDNEVLPLWDGKVMAQVKSIE